EQLPSAGFILEQARQVEGRPVLHSHGAIRCLEALLGLVAKGGLILASDYGQAKEVVAEGFEHQRFSLATFVGVNFPLLRRYFLAGDRASWVEPSGEEASIHSRLLLVRPGVRVTMRFEECFSETARQWLEEPAQRARELARHGRFQAALGEYTEALKRQPF